MGHLLVSGCGNLRVFREFKMSDLFKVMLDSDGEGVSISAEGKVHGVALLQGFSDSFWAAVGRGEFQLYWRREYLGELGVIIVLGTASSELGMNEALVL